MTRVTDPEILKHFQNSTSPKGQVTDPEILKHFNNEEEQEEPNSWFQRHWNDYMARQEQQHKMMQDPIGGLVEHWKGLGQGAADIFQGAKDYVGSVPQKFSESSEQIKEDPSRGLLNLGAGAVENIKGLVNLPGFAAKNLLKYGGGELGNLLSDIPGALQIGDTGLQEQVLGEPQKGDELLQLTGSLLGGAGAGKIAKLGGAGIKAAEKLTPSKIFRGQLPAEELAKNLQLAAGTETGLGQILESPMMSRLQENILTKVPFSGANASLQRTGKELVNRGENILSKLGGDAPENLSAALQSGLKTATKDVTKQKEKIFSEYNNAVDKAGVQIGRENTSNTAIQYLEDIQKSPELMAEMAPDLIKTIERLSNPEMTNTAKRSDIFRGKLNQKAHQYYMNGDAYEAGVMRALEEALEKDITQAVEKTGDSRLLKLRDKAMDFYQNEYAPFNDPDIVKFTRRGGDPDLILSTFLKNSKVADRSNQLKKIMDKLPENDKKLIPYAYYSRAFKKGKFDPGAMATLDKQLGTNQRKVLLEGTGLSGDIDNYINLVHKNNKALYTMHNPPTGQQGLEFLGAIVAKQSGHLPELIGTSAAGYGVNKLLTNEKVRNKLVKKMLANEKNKGKPTDAEKLFDKYINKKTLRAGAILSDNQDNGS